MNELIKRFGTSKLITMLLVGGLLLGFFTFIMMRASEPNLSLLFGYLDTADAGRIVERLQTSGVPHEISADGTMVFVPDDQVAKLRMELANDGLPAGGGVGYEIFDKQDVLGTTNALLGINQIRALEGELAKSIRTIQGVHAARVHLVVPKRELFSDNQQEPSASVIVRLRGTAMLSANQVQSIRYLVTAGVPGLMHENVSIIDDRGNLLAKGKDSNTAKDSNLLQQETQNEYELKTARSIESLLDRTLGTNKTRAKVTVDMDFDKRTSTSVAFDPAGQVVRSQTSSEDGSNSNDVLTNNPVTVQNTLPGNEASAAATGGSRSNSTTTQENVQYEISNTTQTLVKEVGSIVKQSIAVMVDGTYDVKEDGTKEYKPLPEADIEKLTELVKTAAGFDEKRGDQIKVINMKFYESPADQELEEEPENLLNLNFGKLAELGITALVVIIGLLFVLRPMILSIFAPQRKLSAAEQALAAAAASQKQAAAAPGVSPEQIQGMQATPQYVQQDPQYIQQIQQPQNVPQQVIIQQAASPQVQYRRQEVEEEEEVKLKKRKGIAPELAESLINIEQIEGMVGQSSIRKVADLVEKHPEESVGIVRTWMHGG